MQTQILLVCASQALIRNVCMRVHEHFFRRSGQCYKLKVVRSSKEARAEESVGPITDYHLVIVDDDLPDSDGITLIDRTLELDLWSIPSILLSGRDIGRPNVVPKNIDGSLKANKLADALSQCLALLEKQREATAST